MNNKNLIILIFLSLGLILWQKFGMNKTLTFLPSLAERASMLNDDISGGASIGSLSTEEGFVSLSCQINRVGNLFPFCSVLQPINASLSPLDLSGYDALEIEVELVSDSRDTILVYILENLGVNEAGYPVYKAMLRTLDPKAGKRKFTLPLEEFLVPSWWMFAHPDKDSSSNMQSVTHIQISTGDAVHERSQTINVYGLAIKGKWIGANTLYFCLALIWLAIIFIMIVRANKLKEKFFTNMSHEIKTPVNGMIMALELAQSSNDTKSVKSYLDIAKSASKSLIRIIDDILDVTKLESGKLVFVIDKWSPYEKIREIQALMGPVAENKGLEFIVENNIDKDKIYLGDSVRIGQVINNLLSNAIKFTDDGKITLRAGIDESASPPIFFIEVEDTGCGIAHEDQKTIFDRFVQAGKESHKRKGAGLGLSISKNIVDLMGGNLQVTSDGKTGSRFILTIPA